MKKNSFVILVFVSLFFSACKNPNQDKITHGLLYESLPAWQAVSDFKIEMTNAQFRNMVWIQTPGESAEKAKQKMFVNDAYQKLKEDLQETFKTQSAEEKGKVDDLIANCDKQILLFKNIMNDLSSVAAYNDPSICFADQSMVLDNDGECSVLTKAINDDFDWLQSHYKDKMQLSKDSLSKMLMK